MRLVLPETLNDQPEDFKWISDAQAVIADDKEVIVDFSRCRFIRYNGVAWLGAECVDFADRGRRFIFDWGTLRPAVRAYLIHCGFARMFGGPDDLSPNAVPYRWDPTRDDAAIAAFLRDDWLGRGWVSVSDTQASAVISRMLEIYLNAFDHADAPTGVHSCGHRIPKRAELGLTVVDLGVGIVEKVRGYAGTEFTAPEAIEWALTLGHSTVEGSVRGVGLNELQEIVVKTRGSLSIYSGGASAIISAEGARITEVSGVFRGTLVNVRLGCEDSAAVVSLDEGDGAFEISF